MNQSEREMLADLRLAKDRLEKADKEATEAQKDYDIKEAKMIEYLQDKDADRTARYEGLGFATLVKPRIYAEYKKDNEQEVFRFIEEKGEGELLKITVHPSSLSGFIGRIIEKGETVPDFIGYYLKTKVRLY